MVEPVNKSSKLHNEKLPESTVFSRMAASIKRIALSVLSSLHFPESLGSTSMKFKVGGGAAKYFVNRVSKNRERAIRIGAV